MVYFFTKKMKEEIQKVVLKSIEAIGDSLNAAGDPIEIEVGIPKKKQFGDFSVNTAMVLAKKAGRNPREIAELIIDNLPPERETLFKKVDIAGAGFINFFVREECPLSRLL